VFEHEIQEFPFVKKAKIKNFYAESVRNLGLLHITIPAITPPLSFSPCRPRPATGKKASTGPFHQISIDEFTLLVDVASFGFRPKTIEMATIDSGCHLRFAWSAKIFSCNANHFYGLHLKPARNYLNLQRRHFLLVA
jgi:hypothetical protein